MPNCSRATLQVIIRVSVVLHTLIYAVGWHGYDGLMDKSFDKYFRVHHGESEFAKGEHHINSIGSFRSYAK